METSQPTTPPVYVKPATTGVFGTKIPSTVAFAIGILLFFLPFVEFKCGNTTFANNTGFRIVMGKSPESQASGLFGGNDIKEKSMDNDKLQKGQSQIYALIALGLGLIGLILSIGSIKAAGGGIVTGILSAGALIGLMIDLKKNFNASLSNQAINKVEDGADSFGFDKLNNIKPVMNFTPWFYIAIIAFLAAAAFCYMRMRNKQPT